MSQTIYYPPGMILQPNDAHPFIAEYMTSVRRATCVLQKHYQNESERSTLDISINYMDERHSRYLDFVIQDDYKLPKAARLAPDNITSNDIHAILDFYYMRIHHRGQRLLDSEMSRIRETVEYRSLKEELSFLIGQPIFIPYRQKNDFHKSVPAFPAI